jgi:hypothetical protein
VLRCGIALVEEAERGAFDLHLRDTGL